MWVKREKGGLALEKGELALERGWVNIGKGEKWRKEGVGGLDGTEWKIGEIFSV